MQCPNCKGNATPEILDDYPKLKFCNLCGSLIKSRGFLSNILEPLRSNLIIPPSEEDLQAIYTDIDSFLTDPDFQNISIHIQSLIR